MLYVRLSSLWKLEKHILASGVLVVFTASVIDARRKA